MVTSGGTGPILRELDDREQTLIYGSMGYAAPACFGLALARPDLKVVAIEGDGSMIMALSFFTTLGRYPLKNLIILVVDNETYLSTDRGKLTTATARTANLQAIARGAGVDKVATVTTIGEADGLIKRAFREDGPFVVIVKVDPIRPQLLSTRQQNPDRTEASAIFRRWLMRNRPESKVRHPIETIPKDFEVDEAGPGRKAGRIIYQAVKDSGIDLIIYLPDSVTYPVQELAFADPEIMTVCCAREDEGVAIASGAYYGGLSSAIIIEGSGIGFSGLVLALSIVRRTPTFIVSSHSESLGVRFDFDTTSRLTNEPILRALHIPYVVLTRAEDAPALIRESVHQMNILKMPTALVIPPYVMSARGLG
jgi:thiamine pyrophosphate-dependent acetolactate synthase large subunit-like protein